jgi:hypothetical protein
MTTQASPMTLLLTDANAKEKISKGNKTFSKTDRFI